jgi:hypothetical protein
VVLVWTPGDNLLLLAWTLVSYLIQVWTAAVVVCLMKSQYFHPSRGVRQGDPLSPYLFILCNEVLSKLINRVVVNGRLKGVKVAPGAPIVSSLCYADDVLLFCGAKAAEVNVLMG